MKTPTAVVCALALASASFAFAATPPPTPAPTPAPTPNFVDEPIASAGTLQGPDAALAASVVKALNGDPSLRQSKIAVLGEDGKVFLSGATMTAQQRMTAVKIAEAQAGQGNVVDAMQASHTSPEEYGATPKT